MTEISIRDYTTEGSLVYYSIKIGDWEIDGHATTLDGAFKMIKHNLKTNEQQQLYDIVADWWDEVFCCNPAPLDRDGEYLDKNSTIIDLVNSISEIDDWDKPIPEGVDPYNLTGRDPTQSVWKNGKRPSPDYYEIINGKMND